MNTIRIYSPEFVLLHEFEDYNSCKVTLNYAASSTIALTLSALSTAAPYLLDGFYISIDGAFFVIRARSSGSDQVSLTGYSPDYLLKQRIAMDQSVSGTVDKIVKTLISTNTQGARSLPLICDTIRTSGSTHEWTTDRQRVNTEIEDILKLDNSGIKTTFNGSGFVYDTFQGVDRSTENTEGNEPVVFAVKYDNLLSFQQETGNIDTINVVYIDDEDGNTQIYDPYGASDVNRFETVASLNVDEEGIAASIEDTGKTEMVEPRESITATIAPYTFVYGADYFLGDIVTIEHKSIEAILIEGDYTTAEITQRHNVRIVSMEIDYSTDIPTYKPTFGNIQKDLRDVLKKQQKRIRSNESAIKSVNKRIAALETATGIT